MIIVSQDKHTMIFDKINFIDIESRNGSEFWAVEINCGEDRWLDVGTYKTEERAKEVLQEIKMIYVACELLKVPSVSPTKPMSGDEIAEFMSYEMPED